MDKERKRSLSEVAADYVGERILQGKLAQREKLVRSDIAVALGTSRGPMQDALKQLMYEGFLGHETSKGYSVTMLSPGDAYEIFFLRDNLENLALGRCGGRLLSDSIFLIEDMVLAMKEAVSEDDTGRVIKYDEMFHKQVLLSGRMERLTSPRETLSPLDGTVPYTIRQISGYVSEEQVDLDQEDITAQTGRRRDNHLKHKWLLKILQRGNLEQSRGAINTHYIVNGERIYRIGMKMRNQELFYHV